LFAPSNQGKFRPVHINLDFHLTKKPPIFLNTLKEFYMIPKFGTTPTASLPLISAQDVKLIHDPVMSNVSFDSASISVSETENEYGKFWRAYIGIQLGGFDAEHILKRIK
jgi:hypothetical protein